MAKVLGPCGKKTAPKDMVEAAGPTAAAPVAAPCDRPHVLRPGDRAMDFELTAVVGDDITTVKLSDFDGKWRIVCFYPADFTFV
jgi:peroxiredoxin (alkyl hydroperoxide reductase subunit C)